MMSDFWIGIDLGGSSVKALAVSPLGERLESRRRDFQEGDSLAWLGVIQEMIAVFEESQGHPAASIGLSAPGLVSPDRRSIRNMPGRLEGLVGLDWTEQLRRDRRVPVLNDAQAALAGEAWVGAVQNIGNVLFLTLGTGVGGAAKVDGRILRGAIGRAGHVGHICLDPKGEPDICRTPGSLELAVGNCSIQSRTDGQYGSTHELVEAVKAGNSVAARYWRDTIRHLACGIVSLVNVLDPEVVVIGGGIAAAGATLFEPLSRAVEELEWVVSDHRIQIRPAGLGEWAGAFGAAQIGGGAS